MYDDAAPDVAGRGAAEHQAGAGAPGRTGPGLAGGGTEHRAHRGAQGGAARGVGGGVVVRGLARAGDGRLRVLLADCASALNWSRLLPAAGMTATVGPCGTDTQPASASRPASAAACVADLITWRPWCDGPYGAGAPGGALPAGGTVLGWTATHGREHCCT